MGRTNYRRWTPALVLTFGAVLLANTASEYLSAKRKIDLIQQDKASAGSRVVLKESELNALVRQETVNVAPEGVRDPRVTLGNGTATGFAYIDFPKLRQSQGQPMGPLLSWLLAGEKPVKVEATIRSAAGQATVDVTRVDVGGISISGSALDYLIRNYLQSYYPDAKVGRPFELAHNIERLEVRPSEVHVVIDRAPSGWRKVAEK